MPKSPTAKRPTNDKTSAPAPRRPLLLIWGAIVVAPVVAAIAVYAFISTREPPPAPEEELQITALPTLVTKVESLYNDISVFRRPDGKLMLMFGAQRLNYVESIVNPNDELDLPVEYTQSMVAGALAYPTTLTDAAIVGLGGGRTAWYLHKSVPELSFTAIELDPEVVRLADEYFNVRPENNFAIEVKDGRVQLARTDKLFDVILVDAYRGKFVPFHLLTTEFYKLVAAHLKPGGVAVQNVEPSTMLFDSAVATIKSAFEHIVFISGKGNIIIVGYNGPEKDEATLQRQVAERQAKYGFRYALPTLLERRFTPNYDASTKPLTDDFAPVEYLKAIDRHNEKPR